MCVGAVGALRGAVGGAIGGGVAAAKGVAAQGQSLGASARLAISPNRTPAEAWLGGNGMRPSRARTTANLRHTLTG